MRGFPPNHIFLNTPVESITNDDDGRVRIHLRDGKSEIYDHVILAIHGDQAHDLILQEADLEERAILSGFQTSKNTAILHNDLSFMPRSREAWSAWNYITESSPTSSNVDQVCLTYNMNILQHIPVETLGHVLVTLNPLHLPDPELVQGRYTYSHPLYNSAAIRSQRVLPRIQNTRGISYCGAWTKYGFHEDGFSSGLKVAQEHLGATLPFKFKDSTFSRGRRPVLSLRDIILRLLLMITQVYIVLIEKLFGVERKGRTSLRVKVRKLL
jgi:predicted NAD/FAD-binding protein